jgi:hypothetical protein
VDNIDFVGVLHPQVHEQMGSSKTRLPCCLLHAAMQKILGLMLDA